MGSGVTSSLSNVASLPAGALTAEDDGCAAERDATARTASRRNNTSLLVSNSICLSRGVGDHMHYLLFTNATGELQMRRDAMYACDPTHCCKFLLLLELTPLVCVSVQLPHAPAVESLLGAPVSADRRAPRPSQVESRGASLPAHDVHWRLRPPQTAQHLQGAIESLKRCTVALGHYSNSSPSQIFFSGHDALLFRTAEPRDAALWVEALDYTKEFTWHLWP
ncbi:hypothetical protein PHYSODRAFT_306021 [Phytophthora sojae]|uniref:Uncharacterized protein n=1 Tax=Phytophthora sojae (strain P6497) TaxID=1094619 RepID=G5A7F5_PHYSP|nr:hypothetical protein PHYSODRAFT_306021 [Phytophthora sojae]EGZ07834.1 hypothetical protein PHYSODRAFT_306021 [Phytophthora sojae]|eukprot:XP_009536006.1 hypothetical protein PHYSODRAFT_306021 [Phytophthora sojae]